MARVSTIIGTLPFVWSTRVHESERTRERERERPPLSSYELAITHDKEFAERQNLGRVVVRQEDCPQQMTRQGLLRFYLSPFVVHDTPLQDWSVFTHEIRTKSGKHRHQGGIIIYVVEGKGHSVVDGERINWKKGDLVLLPLRPDGVEHQHFNDDPDKASTWMAFVHFPMRDYVASELTQLEVSADYAAQEAGR
jgi:quercetin dioxygenase-like cupin family protein